MEGDRKIHLIPASQKMYTPLYWTDINQNINVLSHCSEAIIAKKVAVAFRLSLALLGYVFTKTNETDFK